MNSSVCIDSNCYTYLVQAMTDGGKPTIEPVDEKISIYRIYLYRNDILYITPTVRAEYQRIKDNSKLTNHQNVDEVLIGDIPLADSKAIHERFLEYTKVFEGNKNEKDCLILAEAELGKCDMLLTFDKSFLNALRDKTHTIKMHEPSVYWRSLGVQQGAPPVTAPRPTNPRSSETWWRW